MQHSQLLFRIALLCAPVALLSTVWLHLYPIFHACAFPTPPSADAQSPAPFRLLGLGDPQLEGDSSLPDPNARIFPSVEYLIPHLRNASAFEERRSIVVEAAKGVFADTRRWLEGKRKAVDLWGNDWYLAHIVRTLRWWTRPTHVTVLGDLLGSQWVTDGEFEKRAGRYWNTVMYGLEKVPDSVFGVEPADEKDNAPEEVEPEKDNEGDEKEDETVEKKERKRSWGGTTEILGADKDWEKRVINIAGNHDVGYAGDIDESRIDRFEKAFGSVNWDIWFTLPEDLWWNSTSNKPDSSKPDTPPALRLVILNSMNLDTPAWSSDLQTETYAFMNHIITTSRPVTDKSHATILLTHIPLEKEAGVCVDSPFFDFFEGGHGVKEQNMLSDHASKIVLEGIFGMSGNKAAMGEGFGRKGIVMNGHDHEGCDVLHWIRQPGVEESCCVDDLKQEEAYWPTATPNNSISIPAAEIDGIDANMISPNGSEAETTNSTNDRETEPSPEADSTQTPDTPELDLTPKWRARRFPPLPYDVNEQHECTTISKSPHIREITLRSMMGQFSGFAGFLSAWFDPSVGENGEWVFEFATCGLGVQHWWWGIYILDFVVITLFISSAVFRLSEGFDGKHQPEKGQGLKKKGE